MNYKNAGITGSVARGANGTKRKNKLEGERMRTEWWDKAQQYRKRWREEKQKNGNERNTYLLFEQDNSCLPTKFTSNWTSVHFYAEQTCSGSKCSFIVHSCSSRILFWLPVVRGHQHRQFVLVSPIFSISSYFHFSWVCSNFFRFFYILFYLPFHKMVYVFFV